MSSADGETRPANAAGESKNALLSHNTSNGEEDGSDVTVTVVEIRQDGRPSIIRRISSVREKALQDKTTKKSLLGGGHTLSLLVQIICIVIGSLYLHDCPGNRNIPVYLIVSGVILSLGHISTTIDSYRNLEYLKQDGKKPAILSIISAFMTIWLICGCVWTFGLYSDIYYEPWQGPFFCNYTLYWFAFWLNIFLIISLLITILCICCLCGCVLCFAKNENKDDEAADKV